MHLRILPLLCTVGMLLALGGAASAADADNTQADEQTLRVAGLVPDGATLLDFFRKRSQLETSGDKVAASSPNWGTKRPKRVTRLPASW